MGKTSKANNRPVFLTDSFWTHAYSLCKHKSCTGLASTDLVKSIELFQLCVLTLLHLHWCKQHCISRLVSTEHHAALIAEHCGVGRYPRVLYYASSSQHSEQCLWHIVGYILASRGIVGTGVMHSSPFLLYPKTHLVAVLFPNCTLPASLCGSHPHMVDLFILL